MTPEKRPGLMARTDKKVLECRNDDCPVLTFVADETVLYIAGDGCPVCVRRGVRRGSLAAGGE